MKVNICTNTETLRPIWADIWENASLYEGTDAYDEEIAAAWVSAATAALYDLDHDPEYRPDYTYWHGGPGAGTWHHDGDPDPAIAEAIATADTAARAAAREAVKDSLCID